VAKVKTARTTTKDHNITYTLSSPAQQAPQHQRAVWKLYGKDNSETDCCCILHC